MNRIFLMHIEQLRQNRGTYSPAVQQHATSVPDLGQGMEWKDKKLLITIVTEEK